MHRISIKSALLVLCLFSGLALTAGCATSTRSAVSAGAKFTDNGNGTVTDNNTRLTWQKWVHKVENPLPWIKAAEFCKDLNLAGTGWRLPAKDELMGLVDKGHTHPHPTIDSSFFPDLLATYYWSSTPDAGNQDRAWYVDFGQGRALCCADKRSDYYAWCVRP